MSLIFLGLGTATLGITRLNEDGSIISQHPAQWKADPNGSTVAVGTLDPETMELTGDLSLFGDWDAAGYLGKTRELLQPSRPVNIPDFKSILKTANANGDKNYFCEHCQILNCRDCIVTQWKEEFST